MFEFEEAGGLHDVFLNKHAVSSHQNNFPKFERQMFNKKNSKMEEFSSSFTNTSIAGNAIVMMTFFFFREVQGGRTQFAEFAAQLNLDKRHCVH